MRDKIFFLSDFHLGAPNRPTSLQREKKIIRFLEKIRPEAAEIFILGDMFDFWFEYQRVVPKGYVRLLGKLAEIRDSGIPIKFFTGNHDMWMKDYFQSELGVELYYEPTAFEFSGKQFLIGHGDGLGPGDHGYKRLKSIFRNPLCQWLFGLLPPKIGIGLADYFSKKSRAQTGISEDHFLGEEKEWLVSYCKEQLEQKHYDYFIFGHRHLPISYALKENSTYLNAGDWIKHFTYVEFDGTSASLKYFVE